MQDDPNGSQGGAVQDEVTVGRPESIDGDAPWGSGARTVPAAAANGGTPVPDAGEEPASGRSQRRTLEVANEAIPAVPPPVGTDPVGSIPAARGRRIVARAQALNWRLFLVRFVCAGVAVVLTVAVLPGLGFVGWTWGQFARIALVFGLLNAIIKPMLQFLVLRYIFSTYGIVVVIVNALMLLLLAAILEDTFEVYRPIALVAGGLMVGLLGMAFETVLGATPPVVDRDYKDRNGLT